MTLRRKKPFREKRDLIAACRKIDQACKDRKLNQVVQKGYKPQLKTRSDKRRKEEARYNRLVAQLIREARERGEVCPVVRKIFTATSQIDQCHHMAGREGRLLLMREHFLLCSWIGHEWIHQNPDLARENGWLYEVNRVGNEYVKTTR